MVVIGVDPGKNGAWACIEDGKLIGVVPFKGDITQCRSVGLRAQTNGVDFIVVEKVTASPKQGVVSAFTFGRYYEAVLTSCMISGVTTQTVRPQVWQEMLGCPSRGDKNVLYRAAQKLFPEEYANKLFNKSSADAVLIAYYAYELAEANSKQSTTRNKTR